jgi:hypothetical protein
VSHPHKTVMDARRLHPLIVSLPLVESLPYPHNAPRSQASPADRRLVYLPLETSAAGKPKTRPTTYRSQPRAPLPLQCCPTPTIDRLNQLRGAALGPVKRCAEQPCLFPAKRNDSNSFGSPQSHHWGIIPDDPTPEQKFSDLLPTPDWRLENLSEQPESDRSSNFLSPLHDHAYDCSQIQSVGCSRQHGDKPFIGGALSCMTLL